MATITAPVLLDATGQSIVDAINNIANNTNLKGEKGDKGDKGDDGYPFLIYKQYDDISEFNEADFPETGLMFMIMTAVPDNGYPVYRYDASEDPPYSFITYLQSEAIKGEKGDKGDTGDSYIPVIDTVTTLPMGSNATASIVLDSVNKKAKYSFGIPQSGVDDKIYRGTKAKFDALSQAEQDEYTIRFFTDDGIATFNTLGVVKPDGLTTRVDTDGTLSATIKDKEYNYLASLSVTAGEAAAGTVTFTNIPIGAEYYVDATIKVGSAKHKIRFSEKESDSEVFTFNDCRFEIIALDEQFFDYSITTTEYGGNVIIDFNVYTLTTVDALKTKISELESTVAELESTAAELESTVTELTATPEYHKTALSGEPAPAGLSGTIYNIPANSDFIMIETYVAGTGKRQTHFYSKIPITKWSDTARTDDLLTIYDYFSSSKIANFGFYLDWTESTLRCTGDVSDDMDPAFTVYAYVRQ